MIHRFVFLRRSPDLALEAFRKRWRNAHEAQVQRHFAFWRTLPRYVQNVVRPAVEGFTLDPLWDGVEQLQLPGDDVSSADLGGKLFDYDRDDQTDFVDRDQLIQFVAEEKVVIDGPQQGVKIISMPRRRQGLGPEEFSHHYFYVHGSLVRKNAAFVRQANRYVQHHVRPGTAEASAGLVPYDGVSEFWFDSLDHAKAAWGAASYMDELRSDEQKFVANPPSHRLVIDEVRFDRGD